MASYDDTTTVSGSVVSIENGADEVGAKSCVVTVRPTLSGVSALTEKQTGKTVFYPMDIEQGSISGSGYNSDSIYRIRTAERKAVTPSTQYKIKVNSEVQIYEVHEYTDLTGSSTHLTVNASEYTFTTKSTTNYLKILFRYSNNATITPSAITELQVTDGALYWKTYSANLGRTIHGGQADIVNGEGQELVKKIAVLSFSGTWGAVTNGYAYYISVADTTHSTSVVNPIMMQANQLFTYGSVGRNSAPTWQYGGNDGGTTVHTFILPSEYDTLTKANNFLASLQTPLEVTLTLATPTDFAFDPVTVETAKGNNTFWSDQGNTELTYYKDGYGFTSVTIHKETPDGEPVEETRKLHRIIYEGQVDVISGTGLIYRGESGTQYDPPEQISFTPIEVSTDEGENTLYADEGDSAITYRKAVD